MLAKIIFSIYLIYTVRTEDNVQESTYDVPQTSTSDQGVLNESSSDGRRLNVYYDHQMFKPGVIENPEIRIDNPMTCKNSGVLLKVLNVLMTIVNKDISPAERATHIAEIIKEYLEYAPNDPPHTELYVKLKGLVDGLNEKATPTPVHYNKKSLRTGPENEQDNNIKTKIVFQYKLPSLNKQNCKEVFLKLNQEALDAYMKLAAFPMCRSPTSNRDFPYLHYDIFGSHVEPQNPFYDVNKDNKYINSNYISVPKNEADNNHANKNPTSVPLSEGNINYDIPNSKLVSGDETPNINYHIEPVHLDTGNKDILSYLQKLFYHPNNDNLTPDIVAYDENSNRLNPFQPGNTNPVNKDILYYITHLLRPHNKLNNVLSINQRYKTLYNNNGPNNANDLKTPKKQSPESNYLDLSNPISHPITAHLNNIYKQYPNKTSFKVLHKLANHEEENPIYGQDDYHLQASHLNPNNPKLEPYDQDAFNLQGYNPYQTQDLPDQQNVPYYLHVPTEKPLYPEHKHHQNELNIQVENQYHAQNLPDQLSDPYNLQVPPQRPRDPNQNAFNLHVKNSYQTQESPDQQNFPYYLQVPTEKSRYPDNKHNQNELNIQVENPYQSQNLPDQLNTPYDLQGPPQRPRNSDQIPYQKNQYDIHVENPYQSQNLPDQLNVPYDLQMPPQRPRNPDQIPYQQTQYDKHVENPYQSQNFPDQLNVPYDLQVPPQRPRNSDQKPYQQNEFTMQVENPYQTQNLPYQTHFPDHIKLPGQKNFVQKSFIKYNVDQSPNKFLKHITYLNSKLNHGHQFTNGHKITNLPSLHTVTNSLKLDSLPSKAGVIELTYLLKRPNPLVYQPFYYVKYRLPYATFLYNINNLLTMKPQLKNNPEKLYQELIALSNVSETSPDLKGFKKDYILKLTFNNGALVGAKMIQDNVPFEEQFKVIQNINTDLSADEIFKLGNLVTQNVPRTPYVINSSQMNIGRSGEFVNPAQISANTLPITIYSQQPFNYESVYDVSNNLGSSVLNADSSNTFNAAPAIDPIELSITHPAVNIISDPVPPKFGSPKITESGFYQASSSSSQMAPLAPLAPLAPANDV